MIPSLVILRSASPVIVTLPSTRGVIVMRYWPTGLPSILAANSRVSTSSARELEVAPNNDTAHKNTNPPAERDERRTILYLLEFRYPRRARAVETPFPERRTI